jgi:hypothetical protein
VNPSLSDYIHDQAQYKFEWGVRDCVLFVSRGFKVLHDIDITEGMTPWNNEEETVREMKKLGTNILEAAKVQLKKQGLVEVDKPQHGDIAVYKTPTDYTFFICVSEQTMCCLGSKGVVYTNTKGTFFGVR